MKMFKISVVNDKDDDPSISLDEAIGGVTNTEFELEWDDLGVEVSEDYGGDPIPDGRTGGDDIRYSESGTACGTINDWSMTVTPGEADVYGFLKSEYKKKKEDVTAEDVYKIIDQNGNEGEDYDNFVDYLEDAYRADAEEDAAENYTYDDVEWEAPEDGSDEDFYED